jgi:hypothetical protein
MTSFRVHALVAVVGLLSIPRLATAGPVTINFAGQFGLYDLGTEDIDSQLLNLITALGSLGIVAAGRALARPYRFPLPWTQKQRLTQQRRPTRLGTMLVPSSADNSRQGRSRGPMDRETWMHCSGLATSPCPAQPCPPTVRRLLPTGVFRSWPAHDARHSVVADVAGQRAYLARCLIAAFPRCFTA